MLWETISAQFHLEQSLGQQLCESLDSTAASGEGFRSIGGIFHKHISGNCVLAFVTKIRLVFQFMFHRGRCEKMFSGKNSGYFICKLFTHVKTNTLGVYSL